MFKKRPATHNFHSQSESEAPTLVPPRQMSAVFRRQEVTTVHPMPLASFGESPEATGQIATAALGNELS